MMRPKSEEWRDIPGFTGYQVSQLGNVRSFHVGRHWRLLKQATQKGGYLGVHILHDSGKYCFRRTHSLVALVFIGPVPRGFCVHHKDSRPANNLLTNLMYMNRGDHIREHLASLSCAEVKEVRYLYMNHEHNIENLAKLFGVSYGVTYNAIADLAVLFGGEEQNKCRISQR